ncbi:hypothetical protein ACVWWN_002759 [Mycobacterium sp. URHB0021]
MVSTPPTTTMADRYGDTGRAASVIRANAAAAANTVVMPAQPSRWWLGAVADPLSWLALFAATAAVKESASVLLSKLLSGRRRRICNESKGPLDAADRTVDR